MNKTGWISSSFSIEFKTVKFNVPWRSSSKESKKNNENIDQASVDLRRWNNVINNETEQIRQKKSQRKVHVLAFPFKMIKKDTIRNRYRNPEEERKKKRFNDYYLFQ